MPRHKWDVNGYELIDRNYPIKCPNCKEKIYITHDVTECDYCGISKFVLIAYQNYIQRQEVVAIQDGNSIRSADQ